MAGLQVACFKFKKKRQITNIYIKKIMMKHDKIFLITWHKNESIYTFIYYICSYQNECRNFNKT